MKFQPFAGMIALAWSAGDICTMVMGKQHVEKAECTCEATCTLNGDPHLTTFFNHKTHLGHEKQITLYAVDDYAVIAHLFEDWFIGELQYGDKTMEASSCTEAGQKFHADEKLGNGDRLGIEVTCEYPKSGKYQHQMHLNIVLKKQDTGAEANFRGLEDTEHASGACISVPKRGAEANSNNSIKCECSSACFAYGDPHVVDFEGKNKVILNTGKLLMYQQGDFEVIADVQHTRVQSLSFGGNVHTASAEICKQETCHNCNHKFHESHKFSDRDSLVMELTCRYLPNAGFFFDVLLTKHDVALDDGESFRTIENELKTNGACRAGQSAQKTYREGSLRR